jgi:hypothetical protein
MFEFPFPVPEDLSTVGRDDLAALLDQIRTFAAGLVVEGQQVTPEALDGLRASRDLATAATTAITEIDTRDAEVASLLGDISANTALSAQPDATDDDGDDSDETVQDEEPAVVAAAGRRRPSVRNVAQRGTGSPNIPPDAERRRYATMRAAADVPTFTSGQTLDRFADAAAALTARMDQYPTPSAAAAAPGARRGRGLVVMSDGGKRHPMENFSRHGAVQFIREFPPELTIDHRSGGRSALEIAEYAASEKRLPGGSLVASAALAVKQGRSLTAAAGWCAPSETIWDLCELETLDGILDLPELTATRGGFNIPANGGPDFSTIWTGLGTTRRSEAEVIAESPAKTCYEIPCHEFEDVRLGVDYFCLTGSLLQRRGYPEVVARFGRGAVTALAHKINMAMITAIVAAAGGPTVIPQDASGDDAISGLMSAIDLAVIDAKYRNRMGFNATLEIVLPYWVLGQLRASKTRRTSVDPALVDAEIMAWFAARKAVPRFVYDWQDSFSGLATGPGGAVRLWALPTTVNFLIYPAGTFVKAVQSVVNLDTVYDSTKLSTNEYTAVFVEDGTAILQLCPYAEEYTAVVDPSGVAGCCPTS